MNMSSRAKSKSTRVGIVGYGAKFKMGKVYHAAAMDQTGVLDVVAVCDTDPKRLREAREDFGEDILTFSRIEEMLADGVVDMCVVITPPGTHAKLAVQCLKAGKHVIVEKPMCVTYGEATKMIAAAQEHKLMLSVFHNRRWDGYYLAMKQVIADGLLGEIFHIEAYKGGWVKPDETWRADKKMSGGAFYAWGAHYVDWVLGLVPDAKLESITGFFHYDVVWKKTTNENQGQALIRFDNGCVADIQMSDVALAARPRWRILGTRGAIEDWAEGTFTIHTQVKGYPAQIEVKYQENQWPKFYHNIAAHLTRGAELIVTPEQAARTVAVMEYAGRSSKQGKTLRPPCP